MGSATGLGKVFLQAVVTTHAPKLPADVYARDCGCVMHMQAWKTKEEKAASSKQKQGSERAGGRRASGGYGKRGRERERIRESKRECER